MPGERAADATRADADIGLCKMALLQGKAQVAGRKRAGAAQPLEHGAGRAAQVLRQHLGSIVPRSGGDAGLCLVEFHAVGLLQIGVILWAVGDVGFGQQGFPPLMIFLPADLPTAGEGRVVSQEGCGIAQPGIVAEK